MNYPKIKNDEITTKLLDDFSGGTDKNSLDSNSFKYSKNLVLKDNSLVTRPAISTCNGYLQTGEDDGTFPLKITDLCHFVGGKRYNLAYYSDRNGGNYNKIKVYLVGKEDDIMNFGFLSLSKQKNDPAGDIYKPQTVVFYSGTKTKGCGIYALVSYLNSGGEERYGVFEAEEAYYDKEWAEIAESERYIPTVLINGRGADYDHGNEVYNLNIAEPYSPEKPNLITPYVKAYFTSDGFSSAFFMPDQYYDRNPLKCIVYNTDTYYYEFIFDSRGRASGNMFGAKYTVVFDYLSGMLSFFDGETGSPRALPPGGYYKENNIALIVSKSGRTDPTGVLSCNEAVTFNSRAYLYKSKNIPNGVYSCKVTNPLYFPTNMQTLVGSDVEKITGAGYQNDKLIVFKEGETFKVNTSTAENEIKFLSPDIGVHFAIDSLSNESISTKVGCIDGATIASCTGQLVWLGSDKKVYTLEATTYGSEKNVFSISEKVDEKIEEYLKGNVKPFAFVKDGYYYLFCGRFVFVCDCHITNMGYAARYGSRNMKNVSWYLWELPIGNYTSGKLCDEIMITAVSGFKNGFLHFTDSETDNVFKFDGEPGEVRETQIPICFESADYKFGTNHNKIIKQIEIETDAGPTDYKIITDNRTQYRHIHNIKKTVQIRNLINSGLGTKRLSLSLNSVGKFRLRSISVDYKAVN